MKVAFHLRRRPTPGIASAVLLESDRVEALLDLASRLGSDRFPPIHRVADGFLIELDGRVEPPPGPIRLRRLAGSLYLPVDADLVPALLDDEAEGLTRNRGLVFLPGGRVLGFDPGEAVLASALVTVARRDPGSWRPFPDRPARPDRIREILLEPPDEPDGGDFEETGDPTGIGAEGAPRPEDAGAATTLAGRAAVGAGKGLIGLGAMLGIKALADLGADWISRAVGRVPRLTESMLGKQEGALRELLRQFRDGEVERALRHALPLGGSGGRGGLPSTDGKLPTVDPTYSLQSLLGSNRGPSGIWFGGFDVHAELAKEYRKVAEEAERQGDYRRAAYIHGKLLNDFATAANLLSRGGLHRDAAYLQLNRLKDIPAAARCFEAAGEVDRALQLYRQKRLHVEAGDLLRRFGEEESAVAEYVMAAEILAADPDPGLLASGDLLRDRAGRPDLALNYYAEGWARRPSSVADSCSLKMAAIFADRGEVVALVALIDQADERHRGLGSEVPAVAFYNQVAHLADHSALAEARDDLRDRALMGMATVLRRGVASSSRRVPLASTYFGRNLAWSPDLVGDADHALKAEFDLEAERRRLAKLILGPTARREPRRIGVRRGVVSAACHSSTTGEVFLGFEGGRVDRIDVADGAVTCLTEESQPIASMAVDPGGQTLVMIVGDGPGPRRLVHLQRSLPKASGWVRQTRRVDGPGEFWLTPVMADGQVRAVGLWNGEEMVLFGGVADLTLWIRMPMPFLKTDPPAAVLVPPIDGKPPSPGGVLIHDSLDICHVESMGQIVRRRLLDWRPTLPEGNTLRAAPLAWLQVDPERFELAGLDREGAIHWSALKINDVELIRTSNNQSAGVTSYSATTLMRPGLVAGVTAGRVDWLRCGPQSFTLAGSIGLTIAAPLACFPAHRTDELVVVGRDGELACIALPR